MDTKELQEKVIDINKRNLNYFLLIYLCLILIAVAYFTDSFQTRMMTYLLIAMLTLVGWIPIITKIKSKSFNLVEPGIWFALYYFIHFGLRAIYDLTFGSHILGWEPHTIDFQLLNSAIGMAIIGLLFFWIGYYIPFAKIISAGIKIFPRNWNKNRAILTSYFCLITGWSLRSEGLLES